MKSLFIFLALGLTGILQSPSPAQVLLSGSRTISGIVLDPSGAAIPGANVTLTAAEGNPVQQTVTDSAGMFRFNQVPAGNFTIDIQAAGFRETKTDQVVGARQPPNLRVVMPISVENQTVNVGAEEVPLVSTEVAENQNANTIDRNALDRSF